MTVVLLVGTWHFADDDEDLPVDQLDAVVEHLATRFQPTVVAVEIESAHQATVDEAYPLFRKGEWSARNEAVQLGFRLAARCGLDGVAAVDVHDTFWDDSVEEVAHRRPDLQDHYEAVLMASLYEPPLGDGTVGGRLRALNTPEVVAATWAPYVGPLLSIAEGDDYPGAVVLGRWWRRNYKIAVNLQMAMGPDDRVCVIYGMGHVPILHRILADLANIELADPQAYL